MPMVGKPLRKVKSQGSKDSQHMLSPQSSQDSVESVLSGEEGKDAPVAPPELPDETTGNENVQEPQEDTNQTD
jgi:hypothetical protein